MKPSHRPLIIGNWKMNPDTITDAKKLFTQIKQAAKKNSQADVVIATPYVFLSELKKITPGNNFFLGAQNVSFEIKGAHTGEVSMAMLSDCGVAYVIVGHSERRAAGESDEAVAKKIQTVLKAKAIPVVCVGEKVRDGQGNFYLQVEAQIVSALSDIPKNRLKDVVVAYEPIWAISTGDGKGKTATAEDVVEMHLYIHKVLAKHFGRNIATKVRVIYGGSVNAENAKSLHDTKAAAGFLVGGASLKAADFATVMAATK